MSVKERDRFRSSGLFVLLAAVVLSHSGCRELSPEFQQATPKITLTPGSLSTRLVPGTTLQVPIVARLEGGPTRANLSVGGSLPPGVVAMFSPASVTDSMTATMTLVADSTASPGLFVYDVVGTEVGAAGTPLVARTAMTGEVEVPFALTVSGSQTVTVGTSRDVTIGVSRKPSFVAPVGLSLIPNTVPAGTTANFTPPAATGANATLQLQIPANAATGQYLVRTVGRYGVVRDTAVFLMTVQAAPVPPEITVVATPTSATVVPGESAAYTLAFSRNLETLGMGNFSQAVSGLPAGATATFTPTVPQATSQLVVATTNATPDGTYPLTVTATLGNLVKTATVNLVVATPPNFTLALTPAAITVNRGFSADGAVTVTRTGPQSEITIDAISVPAGVVFTPTPAVLTANASSGKFAVSVGPAAVPGTYSITVRGVGGALTRTATLTLTIPAPPPSDITISVVNPNTTVTSGGTVQIPIKLTRTGNAVGQLVELRTTGIPPGGNAWITPSFTTADTAMLNVIGGTAGEHTVAVSVARGAFPPTDIARITVTPTAAGDFSLLPAPQTLNISAGSPTQTAVQIGRTNGFAGAVSFVAIADRPNDFQVSFSLNSTTGSGIGMTITVGSNVPVGPRVLRIRGTSGNIVHEVTMTLNVTTYISPYPYYPYGIKRPPPE